MFYTYQDLINVGDSDDARIDFVKSAIYNHKSSKDYKDAWTAEQYNKHQNVTITEYQKLLYTVTGKAIPDNYSANFKMACRHFHRFIIQENQFLLGNGVTWDKDGISEKLGTTKKPFDTQLQLLGKNALIHKMSFGFWNVDHLDVFTLLEFVPLFDEENGTLRAGIRFWQLDGTKPLRATLYEEDGFTEFSYKSGKNPEIIQTKRPYVLNVKTSVADGTWISGGENYPGFPIIPLWGNPEKQSELTGLREQIDCYDLIKSGFANTVDEASYVYWTIQNAGGMDDIDLAKFVEKMRTIHAAVVEDDGARAESHQLETPYAARDVLLNRLNNDLYRDAMALDVENIAGGAATATQIKAAYEPLNAKCDEYEYCVREFISLLLDLVGIEANPSFTRSVIVNRNEDIQSIMLAAQFLDGEYVTKKLLEVFGDGDMAEEMLEKMAADELARFNLGGDENAEDNIGTIGEEDSTNLS